MPLEELLRRLALQDESVLQPLSTLCSDESMGPRLSQRNQMIARLGALIALSAPIVSYQSTVIDALAAGVTAEEIVGALIAVAPIVGVARVTSATPKIAAAMGYDLDEAFEQAAPPLTPLVQGGDAPGVHR